MKQKQDKVYAKLDTAFKDLLIPMELLEPLLREGRLIRTSYEDDSHVISEVTEIRKSEFFTQEELDFALAQQKLEGAST